MKVIWRNYCRTVCGSGRPSFFLIIFPDLDIDAFEAERRDWLDPHYVDTETGRLLMSP